MFYGFVDDPIHRRREDADFVYEMELEDEVLFPLNFGYCSEAECDRAADEIADQFGVRPTVMERGNVEIFDPDVELNFYEYSRNTYFLYISTNAISDLLVRFDLNVYFDSSVEEKVFSRGRTFHEIVDDYRLIAKRSDRDFCISFTKELGWSLSRSFSIVESKVRSRIQR